MSSKLGQRTLIYHVGWTVEIKVLISAFLGIVFASCFLLLLLFTMKIVWCSVLLTMLAGIYLFIYSMIKVILENKPSLFLCGHYKNKFSLSLNAFFMLIKIAESQMFKYPQNIIP